MGASVLIFRALPLRDYLWSVLTYIYVCILLAQPENPKPGYKLYTCVQELRDLSVPLSEVGKLL